MKKLLLLVLFCTTLCCGCVVGQKIPLTYLPEGSEAVEKSAAYSLSISVTDDRPYILSGDKEESFIGKYRSGYGIPCEVLSEGKISLSQAVARDLEADLQRIGFAIVPSDVAERRLLVSIRDYNFDCFINCRVWHNLQVQIKDASGVVLYTEDVIKEQKVEGSSFDGPVRAMPKAMPQIYAKMIQSIVRNNEEAMLVLKRANETSAQSDS